MVPTITINQALKEKVIFIDTRSPKEFSQDHIPGAINNPILTNEERAIVGTLYKQVSQDKAIEKGLELFSQKLPEFMKIINQHKKKKIVIACWRGGMRSRAVVALLDSLKYNVFQLEGGYKSFREYVRDQLNHFELKPKLFVLCGLTCTGKTELLQQLPNSLDLEGLAQHRSSLYGAIGLEPSSQKKFENLLLEELTHLNNQPYIFVEGESRRIGDIIIPPFLWKAMCNGKKVLITRSIENRVELGIKEYCDNQKKIQLVIDTTKTLFKVISKENRQKIVNLMEEKKYFAAIKILLEKYYDPLYSHTLKEFNFIKEVNSDNIKEAIEKLISLTKVNHKTL